MSDKKMLAIIAIAVIVVYFILMMIWYVFDHGKMLVPIL
jgi:hypothetical protein